MPFEHGLACAIKTQSRNHDFLILEKKAHRFDRHLSDLKGIDPKIHRGKPTGAVCAVMEVLSKPGGNPTTAEVMRIYRKMMRLLPQIRRQHGNRSIFSRQVYAALVTAGFLIARGP